MGDRTVRTKKFLGGVYMILEKVINRVVIQSEYKDFVDKYIDNILTEFEGKIHSIYMCGSIPKGTAKPLSQMQTLLLYVQIPKILITKDCQILKTDYWKNIR